MSAPLLTPREWSDMWQALKDYLAANAAAMEAEAAEMRDYPGLVPRLHAKAETFALVRLHMDEMEAAP